MSSTANERRVPPERPKTPTEMVNLRLALELSRQSFAEEEERRKSAVGTIRPQALQRSASSDPMCSPTKMPPSFEDLIDWTDPAQKEHEDKVASIKKLYQLDNSPLSGGQASASPYVPQRNISVPCFPSATSSFTLAPAVVPRSATAFSIVSPPVPNEPPPALDLFYPQQSRPHPADVRWRSSPPTIVAPPALGSNCPLMVPFRPTSIRLGNGDLIDLGPPPITPSLTPATWDMLKYEFDPLYSSRRSAEIEQKRQEYQKADESAFLNVRPPPKPPRLTLIERQRSASALQATPKSASVVSREVEQYTLDDFCLIEITSDLSLQLALLRSKLRPATDWGASLFISPTVDYALPGAASVMLIVHKDHSWPSSAERDSLTFTCDVSSTVEQILESVLTSFFPNESDIPVTDYGLKVYGLDEYLAPHSIVGHYAFLRQSLAFGDDIRLQVGRLPRPRTSRRSTITDADHHPIAAMDKRAVLAGVQKSSIQLILDTLRGELKKAEGDAALHGRNGVKQSTKALCQLLNRVQPHDLVRALRSYESAATNDDLRREASKLVVAVHRLLTMYCASTAVEFTVTPLKSSSGAGEEPREARREIVSIEEKLLVCVESVHNLREEWKLTYESFFIAAHAMHGAAELCRGCREPPRKLVTEPQLFSYLQLNAWVQFELPLCIAPKEARVCFVLYGLQAPTASPSSNQAVGAPIEKQLAWTSVSLFEHDGLMRQNSLLLPFTVSDDTVVQPWGPRPLLTPTCSDPICLITFPSFSYDVTFPEVSLHENRLSRDFSSLDVETQQHLEDVIEFGVTHSLQSEEKELLWEKRHYLRSFPEALPLVLASAVGWDWACLNNIYTLIDDWSPLTPVQAIELLLPHFPDAIVREKAMNWIQAASTDFLFNFLPQLVEALRFESFEHSTLAALLLDLSSNDSRFAFEVYWQLQQRIDHCSQVPYSTRCILLQNELLAVRDGQFKLEVERQHRLLANLDSAAAQVKSSPDGLRLSTLQQHLATLDGDLLETNVRLPLNPAFSAIGVHVDRCNYFNSLTLPLKIHFRGISTEFGVLHKVGDDMRQDSLVLQMIRMMNDIWLSAELDLRMVTFRCLPTGLKKGMVELIKDCRTLREIQSAQGAAGVFKDDVLKKWLQTQNPSEFEYKVALKNFQLSCAGWCVGTYVLGIGDRHNDNILITSKGHVFHIDFGKYLGDWQMAGGFRRDRVPFIFTGDMAYVINEGSQQPTEQYQMFVDNCCRAFNLLRKRYSLVVNLMKLMSCSDVPGMTMDAVNFVQENLMLNLSETEATVQFTRLIEESLRSKFPRWNFLAHTLAQFKNAPFSKLAGEDDPDKLSFVPHLYNQETDGRIESVHLIRCEKWHLPEKVYMYKVAVRRKGETVASYVYRSYAEFHEFYLKLYRRFPFTPLKPLPKGTNIGRSNVRSVAERRLADLKNFLQTLFELSNEVAHCDLVYTLFHTILRDSSPESQGGTNVPEDPLHSVGKISGEVSLKLTYARGVLNVFVGHARKLALLPGSGAPPDAYVKCYLRPDVQRQTKRKTRIVKRTQNPTYNETENSFLGGVNVPLARLMGAGTDRRGTKVLEEWWTLARLPRY